MKQTRLIWTTRKYCNYEQPKYRAFTQPCVSSNGPYKPPTYRRPVHLFSTATATNEEKGAQGVETGEEVGL